MDENVRLWLVLIIGILFIEVGINGKLGSILGALIDPGSMQESTGVNAFGAGSAASFSGSYSANNVSSVIGSIFGPYAGQAIQIAKAESSLNPNAVNPVKIGDSQATGLFQILYPSTWKTTSYANQDPKDPIMNTKAAYEIFTRDAHSWREWATARRLGLS